MILDREGIEALLPHRAPFLLVDQVLELTPGQRALAIKHVAEDEYWVAGHFPGNPIMPGVLIAEALAQVAGLVFVSDNAGHAGGALYLVGMDKMRFRRPVRPGDKLHLEVETIEARRRMWRFRAQATVDGQRVADGGLLATVANDD